MRRAIRVALCATVVLFLWGCSSEDVVNPTELEPPTNLQVTDLAAEGGSVSLSWGGAVGEYVGYRVYAHTQSLQSLDDPAALLPYQVDEVGSATQAATIYLANSYTYYYVHVRAYTQDNDVSRASNELQVIARPEGDNATIYEFDAPQPNASGFDFSEGTAVSMGSAEEARYDRVDIFLGYQAGTTGGGDLYLCSPKKATSTYQNTASFYGWTGTFDSLDEVPADATYSDNVIVSEGKVVAVRITDENAITNYAKLEITATGGAHPTRTISFRWAYQPAPDHRELVPQP